MRPVRSDVRALVTAYARRRPDELDALRPLLALLDGAVEPTDRATLPGHITCGVAVVDRELRVLHVRHRASGGLLLTPGGHVEDGDRSLLAAALRELAEETGVRPAALCATPQFMTAPLDIDVHTVPANPAKGEPAHQHYDFRFVFRLADDAPPAVRLQDEEVSDAVWLPFDRVTSPALRAKLLGSGLTGRVEPTHASALIVNDRGEYLLHLRDDRPDIAEPGMFSLLGGGREPDDRSPRDTLLRELGEEVPELVPQSVRPFAVTLGIGADGLSVPIQVHEVRWNGSPGELTLTEGVLLHWFAPGALDRLRLSPSTRELLHRHAEQGATPTDQPPQEGAGKAAPHIVGVHLILENDRNEILLGLRQPDSASADRMWHTLAGHCERESAVACLIREAREEAGLLIEPDFVEFVHAVHQAGTDGGPPRLQLFFRATEWTGDPEVREPDRCVEWDWWHPDSGWPEPIVEYTRVALEAFLNGFPYSEIGW